MCGTLIGQMGVELEVVLQKWLQALKLLVVVMNLILLLNDCLSTLIVVS